MPDEENLLDHLPYRHGSWNDDQNRTFASCDELSEGSGHRANVVRNQNPSQRRGEGENFRVFHAFWDDTLRQFEIDLDVATNDARDDVLIKVGVSEEADQQRYLGTLSFFV